MCGLVGIYKQTSVLEQDKASLKIGMESLSGRGPDYSSIFSDQFVGLAHTRLSIIDTSSAGNQPMMDANNQLVMVYNGEFYNYIAEKEILLSKGYQFKNQTDTEVLINMYLAYGESFLQRINGCFSLAIYSQTDHSLLLARDRFGIKPLYWGKINDSIVFGSEIKSIERFIVSKNLDYNALHQYFRFNYIPTSQTVYSEISKLEPGHLIKVGLDSFEKKPFYQLPYSRQYINNSQDVNQSKLKQLLSDAVERRLVSDVPLGTFLSGGVDSSIVSLLAARQLPRINTFSIGYKNEPLFDETRFAQLVAKRINSNHHTFSLTNSDLLESLFPFLDYLDEPFADSSGLPVFILSKLTQAHVKVALSGDGADEIFAGYHKHGAHYKALYPDLSTNLIKFFGGIANAFPQSRNSKMGNLARQISKFHAGLNQTNKERYLSWLSVNSSQYANQILIKKSSGATISAYEDIITQYLTDDFNDILRSDVAVLLPNDMLTKADKFSMANGLEVRTPFLDHHVVEWAFSLSSTSKINHQQKKKILVDTFSPHLPVDVFNRPKHGFEVPLLKWFRTELYTFLFDELLEEEKIKVQGQLNFELINQLKMQLMSNSPGDAVASLWAILVFQYWYDKKIVNFSKKN